MEYLRRKAFSTTYHFSSIEEANEYLTKCYEKLNNTDSNISPFKEEKKSLRTYLYDYQCSFLETAKIDKLATFCYDGTHYSVPDYLVGKTIYVKIYSDLIKVYYNKKEICRHERSYKHTWIMTLDHYLTTLSRKPGALKGAVSFHQVPERLQNIYYKYFVNESKEFIELLLYVKEKKLNYQDIYNAIDNLYSKNIIKVNAYLIRTVIDNASEDIVPYNISKKILLHVANPIADADIRDFTISNISKLTHSINSQN